MSSTKAVPSIAAAGAVLWRSEQGRLLLAVVHRPRYDDWSLPKGKLETGESPLVAAVREVGEETGARVQVGRRLISTHYDTTSGPKQVSYWSMRHLGGEHRPGDEVDVLDWLPVEEAMPRLSYDHDRAVVQDLLRVPVDLPVVLLIRHAKAGKRSQYRGEDRLRPLDKIGRRQARDSAGFLSFFGPTAVFAADRVRCRQTVAPLAERLGVEVETVREFSDEAQASNPRRTLTALRAVAESHACSAVCSQGGAIPGILADLAPSDAVYPARKGSLWVLTLQDRQLVAADYYSHPQL